MKRWVKVIHVQVVDIIWLSYSYFEDIYNQVFNLERFIYLWLFLLCLFWRNSGRVKVSNFFLLGYHILCTIYFIYLSTIYEGMVIITIISIIYRLTAIFLNYKLKLDPS